MMKNEQQQQHVLNNREQSQHLQKAMECAEFAPANDEHSALRQRLVGIAKGLLGEGCASADLAETEGVIREYLATRVSEVPVALINLMLTILELIENGNVNNYQSRYSPVIAGLGLTDNMQGIYAQINSLLESESDSLTIRTWYIFLQLVQGDLTKDLFTIMSFLPSRHTGFMQLIRDYLDTSLIENSNLMLIFLLHADDKLMFSLSLDKLAILISCLEQVIAQNSLEPKLINGIIANLSQTCIFDIYLILRSPTKHQLQPLLAFCNYVIAYEGYEAINHLLDFAPIRNILWENWQRGQGATIVKEAPVLFALMLEKDKDSLNISEKAIRSIILPNLPTDNPKIWFCVMNQLLDGDMSQWKDIEMEKMETLRNKMKFLLVCSASCAVGMCFGAIGAGHITLGTRIAEICGGLITLQMGGWMFARGYEYLLKRRYDRMEAEVPENLSLTELIDSLRYPPHAASTAQIAQALQDRTEVEGEGFVIIHVPELWPTLQKNHPRLAQLCEWTVPQVEPFVAIDIPPEQGLGEEVASFQGVPSGHGYGTTGDGRYFAAASPKEKDDNETAPLLLKTTS